MRLAEYGVAKTHYFRMVVADAVDLAVSGDWTPATGDVKISKDGGALANTSNLPSNVGGTLWEIDITATEHQAASISIMIVDSATKAVEDNGIEIETYGHASAAHETFPADVISISSSTTAADNAESCFTGTITTLDALDTAQDTQHATTQAAVADIGVASGTGLNYEAVDDNTGGAIKSVTFVGVETSGTFASTEAEDGTYHQIDDTGNAIDIVYQFEVGGIRRGVQAIWRGYVDGSNDSVSVQAYDFVGAGWETRATIAGQASSNNITQNISLLQKHTGTGADAGVVLLRFVCSAQSNPTLYTDEVLVEAAVANQSVGYVSGIEIDTNASNTNTTSFVDGVKDNPVSTIAAANTLNTSLNLNEFYVRAGSSITLAASQTNEVFRGEGWNLALGGQNVSNSHFYEAIVTGTGTTAGGNPDWHMCDVGTATVGPSDFHNCNFSGTLTGTAGDYYLYDCKSDVAGASSPAFDFSSVASATTINVRNWFGGSTWTLNSDCVMSLEVTKGGTQTITTGGGDVEVRGFCKAITITTSGTGTTNIIAFAGPITINGTGGTVNVYGQHSGITDNSSGTTVNDLSVDGPSVETSIATILADTNELQTDDVPGLIAALNDIDGTGLTVDLNADQSAVTVGTVNAMTGTITTLDALDTAQDTQHTSTRTVLGTPADTDLATDISNVASPTVGAIADAVWDEAMSGHTTAGTFGKLFDGITNLAAWLGLGLGKTADASTLAEVNATTAGAGYDNTTDSQQAIVDTGSTGPWTTGSVTGDAIITPLSASEVSRTNGTDITYFVGEAIATTIAITDSSGAAVDLSAKTLRIIIDRGGSGHSDVQVIASGSITVAGASSNQITFTNSAVVTNKAGSLRWALRDTDDGDRVLARGNIRVIETAEEDG